MAINWRLKAYLSQKHHIYTATNLQRVVIEKTGIVISLQNLCNLINHRPKMIRLETMEIICQALGCSLGDILIIRSDNKNRKKLKQKKLSFKNTPHSKRICSDFPEPENYKE